MVRLDDLQIFVRAAETGSFSAAARELDIAPAQASAALQRLERALGVRLFVRSTRRMRLSEDGERYLPHARAALSALASGEQVLSEGREEIAGVLKISAPSDLGRNVLLPWLDAFQARHPRLTMQLRISDRMVDLFRQPVDVAIRYGVLEDSSLVSLALAPDNRRWYARLRPIWLGWALRSRLRISASTIVCATSWTIMSTIDGASSCRVAPAAYAWAAIASVTMPMWFGVGRLPEPV